MNNKHAGVKPMEYGTLDIKGQENIIGRTVVKFIIPFIQLFGIYVIIHGELAAGGGFQGGVIIGASFIAYVLVYDLPEGLKRASQRAVDLWVSGGVLLFGGIGLFAILQGGNFLQYNVLVADPKLASHLGIIGIEVGIGISVGAVMILLFNEMVRPDAND